MSGCRFRRELQEAGALAEFCQGHGLEAVDSLAAITEQPADLPERAMAAVVQAEPEANDLFLGRGQHGDEAVHKLAVAVEGGLAVRRRGRFVGDGLGQRQIGFVAGPGAFQRHERGARA